MMDEEEYKGEPRAYVITAGDPLPVVLALVNLANLVDPKGDPLAFTLVVC